jgi:hypothetical protein
LEDVVKNVQISDREWEANIPNRPTFNLRLWRRATVFFYLWLYSDALIDQRR